MLFYEEVPRRPMPLLRLFLPAPVRTEGDKTRVGAVIECTYDGGYLEKRITASEHARSIRFDVIVQQLGIEDSIAMSGGSYDIAERPAAPTSCSRPSTGAICAHAGSSALRALPRPPAAPPHPRGVRDALERAARSREVAQLPARG